MADSPFTPNMQRSYEDLLNLSMDRAQRTEPIHQAAMAMAQRMAPGYAQQAMSAPSSRMGGSGAGGGLGSLLDGAGGGNHNKRNAFLAFLASIFGGGGPWGGGDDLIRKLIAGEDAHGVPTFSAPGTPMLPGNPSLPPYSRPTPGVSTSMDFSVPGGFPNNPENPMSAISNWWDSMPQAGIGRGSGESVPEGEWKP